MSSSKGGSRLSPRGRRLVPAALLASVFLASCASHLSVTKLEEPSGGAARWSARSGQAFVYHLPKPVLHIQEKRLVQEGKAFDGDPVEVVFSVQSWPDETAGYVLEYDASAMSRDKLVFQLQNGVLQSLDVAFEDRSAAVIQNVIKLAGALVARAAPTKAAAAREVTVDYDLLLPDPRADGNAPPAFSCPAGGGPVGGRGYQVCSVEQSVLPTQPELPNALWGRSHDALAYRPGAIYEVDLCYCNRGDETADLKLTRHFLAPALGKVAWVTAPRRLFVRRDWKATFPAGGGITSYEVGAESPAEAATGAAAGWPAELVKSQTAMLELLQELAQKQTEYVQQIQALSEELRALKAGKRQPPGEQEPELRDVPKGP